MHIVGIVCEYNPFHLGHQRQMEQIRALLGPDTAIVCAMSGNFTQRGEPAVFEKHARAEAALACGADLVVEIPFYRAVASAEPFAAGGVETLSALGICTHLAFGSECGDADALERVARCLLEPETDARIRELLASGESYPRARQRAVQARLGPEGALLGRPNDILAVEYLKAIIQNALSLTPLPILRAGEGHDRDACSGLKIREALSRGEEPWTFLPEAAKSVFQREIAAGRGPVLARDLEQPILAALRKRADFSDLPDASEGLDRRLKKYVGEATLPEVIDAVKTKRYTRSRISRMVLCAYLEITGEDVKRPVSYITLLGMNQRGRELLKAAGKAGGAPVITKPAAAKKLRSPDRELFARQAQITDLYTLAFPDPARRRGGQEWAAGPVTIQAEDKKP